MTRSVPKILTALLSLGIGAAAFASAAPAGSWELACEHSQASGSMALVDWRGSSNRSSQFLRP